MKNRLLQVLSLIIVCVLITGAGTISSFAVDSDNAENEGSEVSDKSDDKDEADDKDDEDNEDDEKEKIDTTALQESINQKQGQLNELQQEKRKIEASRSDVQAIINSLQADKQEANSYIAAMDQEVEAIQANIDDLNEQVEAKRADIEITRAELVAAEAQVEIQYEAMKERIRFMYETGDSLYLELLFSSDTFGDMLNKAEYIEQLSEYDRRMLEEYRLTVAYTQAVKDQLEMEEEVLEEAIAAAEDEQNNLNILIEEKEAQVAQYESEISTKEAAIAEYDQELADRQAIIAGIEASIAAEKEQLAEANRINYDGGMFINPAPSYVKISSEFGNRMHPTLGVQKFHEGLDMAAPGGSPILAAYYGKVAATGYTSGMGNYAIIDHGDGLYTIYMHASAISVSQGQFVATGERIGSVGSTGRSTGNHLHFGVRLNGNYVNPRNYLNL